MSASGGAAGPPSQPDVRWHEADAVNHVCDIANAAAGQDDVVVNFGRRQPSAEAPDQLSAQLIRRLTMRPMTARALRDMLRDIVAAIDADRQARG